MDAPEVVLAKLLRELRDLLESTGGLPVAMSRRRAAQELDISVRTLAGMIRRGEVSTCRVGSREHIPRSEVLRLAAPVGQERPRTKTTIRRRRRRSESSTGTSTGTEDEQIEELIRRKD